jgi:Putative amidoligase enzyme
MTNCPLRLPEFCKTDSGDTRRVGIELEFSDINPETIARAVQEVCGGEIMKKTIFDYRVTDTEVGEFVIELDASLLKKAAGEIESGLLEDLGQSLENLASDVLSTAAEQFVPWELVTPPVPFTKLELIYRIVEKLRAQQAQGTRSMLHYAFGTHLNPELPNLDPQTIVAYFKAYLCLYDWIVREENIDLSRRLTPYINHFDKDYVLKVVDTDYWPDLNHFMSDYLAANPTRNRSLDLLPLFCHLDEERLRKVVDDPRVKPRPAFHYRLPNCEIDNQQWNIHIPWHHWLQVESLAFDGERLFEACRAYHNYLSGLLSKLPGAWANQAEAFLA